MLSPAPTHRPFGPCNGKAEKKECKKVGDQKSTAVVFCSKTWKAKEIPHTDRTPRDGKNDTDGRAPALLFPDLHIEFNSAGQSG